MFYFTEKHNFTGAIWPWHNALFLWPKTLTTACNGANNSQTLRCDLERALGRGGGGGTFPLWKNYLSGGIQRCHLYRLTPHDSYIDVQHPIFLLRTPCTQTTNRKQWGHTWNNEITYIYTHTHTHETLLVFNFEPLNIQVTALLPTGG